jgi:hypothetical protein
MRELPGLSEPWATLAIGTIAVIAIIWIVAVVSALKSVARSTMDIRMKIAWIGLIMAAQPLGVVLWIVRGRDHWYRSATA